MTPELRNRIERELGSAIASCRRIRGGAVEFYAVDTEAGDAGFVKCAASDAAFPAEALGLTRMAVDLGPRIPKVYVVTPSLLMMERLSLQPLNAKAQAQLGEGLARLHLARTDSRYGFDQDHFIGATPQQNLPRVNSGPGAWAEFWWTHRLNPLLEKLNDPELTRPGLRLSDRLSELLPDLSEPPSLLHGDLWSGNAAMDEQGCPVLVDPAPYYGAREAEFGMTRLFGGFTGEFYQAYEHFAPLPDGWRDRVPLYTLYHLLNHTLLFGQSYRPESLSILRRFAGE